MPKDLTPEQEARLRPLLEERFADDQFTPLTREDWDRIHQAAHEKVEVALQQIKENEMRAWQEFVEDVTLDLPVYTFARMVGEKLQAFRDETDGAQVLFERHEPISQGVALCFRVNYRYFLWLSVFFDGRECQAIIAKASPSKTLPVEGDWLCSTIDDAAYVLFIEVERLCGLPRNK